MRIYPVPFHNVNPEVNIADTKRTNHAPRKVALIYKSHTDIGVNFLNESFKPATLVFDPLMFAHFYETAVMRGTRVKYFEFPNINRSQINLWLDAFLPQHFIYNHGKRIAFLGGDHSNTYYLFKEFRKHYGENVILINLDAHPDMCHKGKDEPYHSDWLRFVIEKDGFSPRRVISIGWRDAEEEEIKFADRPGTAETGRRDSHYFSMQFIRELGIGEVIERTGSILELWRRSCGESPAIYLSIDFDVFDPSYAPGVSTISPGGLSSYDAMALIKYFASLKNLMAVDLMEIDPGVDVNKMTQLLALKILREMAQD